MRAYRFDNLVYIPIYKNAATSYELLFGKILNWTEILTENIQWDKDTVFAHISNPYVRHLRGTVEFLYEYRLESVVDNPLFERFLISGYFDQHSYPLKLMFGDRVKQINWLPIDHPVVSGDQITVKFLETHGVKISEESIPHKNQSHTNKKIMVDRIKHICEANNYTTKGLYFLLDDDYILYNKVMLEYNQGFNKNESTA